MSVRNAKNAPRFYETSGTPTKFVGKLTKMLTEYGCGSFMVENRDGEPTAIAFQFGGLAYRVRPDVDAVDERLSQTRRGKASAATVAWAQAYALLEMQLEAIENGGAKASEVLGGYVLLDSGDTVGEMIDRRADELMSGERLLLPRGSV